jgi:hypothetical protein
MTSDSQSVRDVDIAWPLNGRRRRRRRRRERCHVEEQIVVRSSLPYFGIIISMDFFPKIGDLIFLKLNKLKPVILRSAFKVLAAQAL